MLSLTNAIAGEQFPAQLGWQRALVHIPIGQTHILPERGPPQVGGYPDRVRSCRYIDDEDADLEVRAPARHLIGTCSRAFSLKSESRGIPKRREE